MIGDVVLQKRSGWLGWIVSRFTGSDFVHCGLLFEDDIIIHVDPKGKQHTPLKEWYTDDTSVIILTPIKPLTETQKNNLFWHCVETPVVGYSFWYAIKSWFFTNNNDWKLMRKRYHCSGFVSAMYRKIGIDLVPNCSDDSTQPQQFLESPLLVRKDINN